MVYPSEQRDRQPVEDRQAHDRRCVFEEQNELENRRIQTGLVAISKVARKIAQPVQADDMFSINARICPGGEDEIFRS